MPFDYQQWLGLDPLEGFVGMINAAYDQRAYRFRNDDGDEATATWKAAQNTPIEQQIGTIFRLRVAVQETAGGSANNQTIVLQYNIDGAGWNDVGPSTNGVRLANSPHVNNGTPTTRQLTGTTGTFIPGQLNTTTSGTNISFAGSDHTENEWASLLIDSDVAHNTPVQFRITVNGAITNTSTVSPSLIAVVLPPDTPTNLGHILAEEYRIDMLWNNVPSANTYELQRDNITVYSGSSNSFSDTDLNAGVTYNYRVRALNEAGLSDWSSPVSVTTVAILGALSASQNQAISASGMMIAFGHMSALQMQRATFSGFAITFGSLTTLQSQKISAIGESIADGSATALQNQAATLVGLRMVEGFFSTSQPQRITAKAVVAGLALNLQPDGTVESSFELIELAEDITEPLKLNPNTREMIVSGNLVERPGGFTIDTSPNVIISSEEFKEV